MFMAVRVTFALLYEADTHSLAVMYATASACISHSQCTDRGTCEGCALPSSSSATLVVIHGTICFMATNTRPSPAFDSPAPRALNSS